MSHVNIIIIFTVTIKCTTFIILHIACAAKMCKLHLFDIYILNATHRIIKMDCKWKKPMQTMILP